MGCIVLLVITNQRLHLVKSCWTFLFHLPFKDQPFSDPGKEPKKSWRKEKLQDLHKGPQEFNTPKANKDSELSALGFYSNIFQVAAWSFPALLWSFSPSARVDPISVCLEHIRYRYFPHLPHAPFFLKGGCMIWYNETQCWYILFSNGCYCVMVILYSFLQLFLSPFKKVAWTLCFHQPTPIWVCAHWSSEITLAVMTCVLFA